MSTKQSSSIRVKTSKHTPWAKKKQNQSKNTKKQNDSHQWPDLNKNNKATQTVISPIKHDTNHPSSNENNTASSTKYKSNPINPTQLNENHTNNTNTIQSPPSQPSNPTQNISNNNISPPDPTKKKKKKKKKNPKPPIPSNNNNNNNNTPSKLSTISSDSNTTITSPPQPPHTHTHSNTQENYNNYNNYNFRRNRGRRHNRARGRGHYRGRGRGRGRVRGRGHHYRGRSRGRYNHYDDRYFNNHRNNMNSAPRHNRQRYNDTFTPNNTPNTITNTNTNTITTTPVNLNIPLVPIHVYPIQPLIEECKLDRPVMITTVNNAYNIYNGGITYYNNPYINPMMINMNMNMNNMALMEPNIDSIHLTINECGKVPAWNGEMNIPSGPYYVLKVSCVATGYTVDDRSVGHIALVDWNLKTKANIFVKPQAEIVSYMTPLTSLNESLLNKYGYSLQDAIKIIKTELPTNAVLIGQNITMDLQWLGLKGNDVDFKTFIDLRDVWRSWSAYYKSYTHYSIKHQARCVLGDFECGKRSASAAADAIMTMKLFQYYLYCRYFNMQLFQNKISNLQETKIEPSFSKKHPVYEGVQMQSKKYKGVPYITAKPKVEERRDLDTKKTE